MQQPIVLKNSHLPSLSESQSAQQGVLQAMSLWWFETVWNGGHSKERMVVHSFISQLLLLQTATHIDCVLR